MPQAFILLCCGGNPVVTSLLIDDPLCTLQVVLKPGDACPKTLNLIFDRSQDFELYVFYEDSPEVKFVGSNLLIGKWKVR